MIRFWGVVTGVKPRLVLTKFEGETAAKCHGFLLRIDGKRQGEADADTAPSVGDFTVAIGPATQDQRHIGPGDLLRGDAKIVPETTHDTPADLYRVGTLRIVARRGDPGAAPHPTPDPPRTGAPLSAEAAESAPRRALHPDNLATGAPCAPCPYGVIVPIVRLSDPRDYRTGRWSNVPACLGPADCPYFRSRS